MHPREEIFPCHSKVTVLPAVITAAVRGSFVADLRKKGREARGAQEASANDLKKKGRKAT